MKDWYDHYSAIYHLLVDRLNQQKQSVGKGPADVKKRRPSTIAEQPLKGIPCTENLQSLRLRTTSESEKEASRSSSQMRSGMGKTDFTCITCGQQILENTTSTTSCAKCARLRTRRMNFAHPVQVNIPSNSLGPWSSRDSGDSGISSQDCGELTPTVERPPAFPRACLGQKEHQMNKLVRKLSEIEGVDHSSIYRSIKTSVDEGVELNFSDSTLSDSSTGCLKGLPQGPTPQTAGSRVKGENGKEYLSSSAASDSSSNCESIGSSNLDSGWTQSLPSCSQSGSTLQPDQAQVQMYRGVSRYNPIAPHLLSSGSAYDRSLTRSPVHFREGRRASDGLVAQGIVAFQQKLYEQDNTGGMIQLQEVREEALQLKNLFSESKTEDGKPSGRAGISKRISVPENFVYFPPTKHLALQQQLLQHKLLQKRQILQKQRFSHGDTLTGFRRAPYGKPYMPTVGLPLAQQGSDCLFQPIAEDEPCLDSLDYLKNTLTQSGSCGLVKYTNSNVNETTLDSLPRDIETICKLSDSPYKSQQS